MSSQSTQPRSYEPGLWTRLLDGARYSGGIGQWSWLLHRVTGIGILLFLVIHIVDTFFVVAYPGLYDHTVMIYGGRVPWWTDATGNPIYFPVLRWAFRLGELGLIACVVFHAVNGLRVALVDLWPMATSRPKLLVRGVVVAFVVIMVPVLFAVFLPLFKSPEFWNMPAEAPAATEGDRF
jgi:succinate dehydrogenase / fumarate reductase cytochrome b subunit